MVLLAPTDTAPIESENPETRTALVKQTAQEDAPIVQRLAAHRDRVYMAVMALESEKFELQSRRDYFRQQFEAVD